MRTSKESRDILKDRAKHSGGTILISSQLMLAILDEIEHLDRAYLDADRIIKDAYAGLLNKYSAQDWISRWGLK